MHTLGKIRIFNGNTLKIIAAAAMLVDHIGVLFFPSCQVFRIIGRVSMPLFAFFIAEGCRYTKNKVRHFSLLFVLAVLCQAVYAIVEPSEIYLSILVTFTLSVIMIYELQYFKKCVFGAEKSPLDIALSFLLFAGTVTAVWFICNIGRVDGKPFYIDYGFWGCMLPVFASLLDFRGVDLPEKAKALDGFYLKLIPFAAGLLLLCLFTGSETEWFAFIALAFLALYNGGRGRFGIKYFFYIFYPAHLALLYGILMLL